MMNKSIASLILFLAVFVCALIFAEEQSVGQKPQYKAPTPFSVQMHSLTGNFENHKKSVDLISALGIKQVRDELFWHLVEQKKGEYKIPEGPLKNLNYSVEKGLDTLIILNYGNKLYEDGAAPSQDESRKAFAKYAYTMAKELRGKVHFFEIWNEPNTDGFWRPRANPKDYALLLKEVYPAIKAGNPDAQVLGISLAGAEDEFMYDVFKAGGYDYMDIVSIHPYCTPKSPEAAQIFDKMKSHYEKFKKFGKQKPIWVTEVGWPTNSGGGVSEEKQADVVARQYLLTAASDFLSTTFIYWFGPDGPDATWAEDRFGIIHQDYSPKPAYTAVKNLISLIGDAKFQKFILDDPEIKAAEYCKKDGKIVTAVWGVDVYRHVRINSDAELRVIFRDGDEMIFAPDYGKINMTISPSPFYIISDKTLEITKTDEAVIPDFSMKLADDSASVPRGMSKTLLIASNRKNTFVGKAEFASKMKDAIQIVDKKGVSGYESELSVAKDAPLGKTEIYGFLVRIGEKHPSCFFQREIEIFDPAYIRVIPKFPDSDEKVLKFIVTNKAGSPISCSMKIDAALAFSESADVPPARVNLSENAIEIEGIKPGESLEKEVRIESQIEKDSIVKIKVESLINKNISIKNEYSVDFYTSYKTAPLKIDGDLSDWNKDTAPIRICYPKQYSGGYMKWDGIHDSSAMVRTAWDDKWFYIGAELEDDIFSDPVVGFGIYNNDGFEIYFDTDYESDYSEENYSADDHQYGLFSSQGKDIAYSWSQLKGESKKSKIKIERNPNEKKSFEHRKFKGMIIEAAIPLKELNLNPENGKMMRFNVAFTDDDDPTYIHPFFQEIQMTWTGKKNSWQNPQCFGYLFFCEK